MFLGKWIVSGALLGLVAGCGTHSKKHGGPPKKEADQSGKKTELAGKENVITDLEALNASLESQVEGDLLWSAELQTYPVDIVARDSSFKDFKSNLEARNVDDSKLGTLQIKVTVKDDDGVRIVATNMKTHVDSSSDLLVQSVWAKYCENNLRSFTEKGKLHVCNIAQYKKRATLRTSIVSCNFLRFYAYSGNAQFFGANQAICERASNSEHPSKAEPFYPTAETSFEIKVSNSGGVNAMFRVNHNVYVPCRYEPITVSLQNDVDSFVSIDLPIDPNQGLPNYRNPDSAGAQSALNSAANFYTGQPQNSRKMTLTSRCTWADIQ